MANTTFNADKMKESTEGGFVNATDVADYLVDKDIPFREAHEIVGKAVLYCIQNGKNLLELTMDEWKEFSPIFEEDIYHAIAIETCVDARDTVGGPARREIERVIEQEKKELN